MRRLGPWAAIGPASEQDAPQAGLPAPGAGQAPRRSGLRERKKARTRAAIRQHALRLIREQGYAATTVDQLAAPLALADAPSADFATAAAAALPHLEAGLPL